MNVLYIYAGEYYAFSNFRPNNKFIMNAQKGKAIKVIKTKAYGAERKSSYVEMELERSDGSTYTTQVRSRDVIDFWDQYENERKALLKEREELEARLAREAEERRRATEERLARERAERERAEREEEQKREQLVTAFLDRTSMPRAVIYSIGPNSVQLDRKALEFWLSTPDNRGMGSTLHAPN